MRSKGSNWAARGRAVLFPGFVASLAMGAGGPTRADAPALPQLPAHFSGLLDDYTPSSVNGVAIKGGPYEMHGKWSLELDQSQGTARFSAQIAMETSEIVNPDPNFDPGKLGAHTHHISVTDGVIHDGPTDWKDMCPALSSPAGGGFAVTGTAYVTGNGSNPPFGNPSAVTICILGGAPTNVSGTAYVEFSNLTLTFESGSHASTHFGPQPIHGVIVGCNGPWWPSHDCRVNVQE